MMLWRRRRLKGGRTRSCWTGASKAGNVRIKNKILVWNSFLVKRGWRDDGAPGLAVEKELSGFANRDDIQTYVDLHDVDEGRTPKYAPSSSGAGNPARTESRST